MSGLIEIKISSILTIKKIIGEREVVMQIPTGSTVAELLSIMISKWGDALADSIFEKSSGFTGWVMRLAKTSCCAGTVGTE